MGPVGQARDRPHEDLINHFMKFRFYSKSHREIFKPFENLICIDNASQGLYAVLNQR